MNKPQTSNFKPQNKFQLQKSKFKIFQLLRFDACSLRFLCSLLFVVCISSFVFAIPSKVFLNIPFSPQAPFGVWDETHNEACEEISIIMAMRYVGHKGLTRMEAEREIQKLVDCQNKKFGGHFDLTVEETAKLMEDCYGFKNYEIVNQASIETVIDALAKGNPVILPMAGRMLSNPNFKVPGPVYHMIIVKGYDLVRQELIVNDGGTKKGLNYRYKFDVIKKAWHDWTGSEKNLSKGKPSAIIIMRQ